MRIATVAHIPVSLHPTFWILAALYAGWAWWVDGGTGALHAARDLGLIFGSVLLHELGHALVARALGVYTATITLYPFGGVAAMALPERARDELWIALGGPAVNAALAAIAGITWWVTKIEVVGVIFVINAVMGGFNLMPAFPMDGGRVLRAALSTMIGYDRATQAAMLLGSTFALIFAAVGAWLQVWSLVLVGSFLAVALRVEHQHHRAKRKISGRRR